MEQLYHDKMTEFGDIVSDAHAYERVLSYSPYHLPLSAGHPHRPITHIMITCDQHSPYRYHSRKLISKIREVCQADPLYAFYREYPEKMYSHEQKMAEHYAFLLNSLLYNR